MKIIYLSSLLILISSCSQANMNNLGLKDNAFIELDNKPHGVSTMTAIEKKKMDPIKYSKSIEIVNNAIKSSLVIFGNNAIITEKANYMHVEFYTLLGFTDDVEFYIDTLNNEIHFKSQSRVGYSDFGTNRSRMKKISNLIKKNI